jgi:transcriptional antiterminator NusG
MEEIIQTENTDNINSENNVSEINDSTDNAVAETSIEMPDIPDSASEFNITEINSSDSTDIEIAAEPISPIVVPAVPNTKGILESDFKWYCIKTYTSHEEKVKKAMEAEVKRLGLEYCIKEVVIPMETVFEVRNGKKKTKTRNFLPGYVLISAAISEQKKTKKKIIDLVTEMTGAVSFVGRKNDPAALHKSEVDRIFGRITERADVATIDTTFSKGDPIIVIMGPFTGFKGTVFEVFNEKRKIKVEIVILGRKTPVELDFDQIQFDKPE